MFKLTSLHTVTALMLLTATDTVLADVRVARDRSYEIAQSSRKRGYFMTPTGIQGHIGQGEYYQVNLEVKKGLDYCILVGGDANAQDVDLYVFDELDNVWKHDERDAKDAGVEHTANYTGILKVYVHMKRSNGLGSFSVLAGRRG
jgi:hypothetical protein